MTRSNWHGIDQPLPEEAQAIERLDCREIDDLTPTISEILQTFKHELGLLYGERFNLVLYGSFARHEETEESDIDVLVALAVTHPTRSAATFTPSNQIVPSTL